MDPVAMAHEPPPPMDNFEPREISPTMSTEDPSPPKKTNIRKRTKTGCMTCRKRRIKCDEGKPICQNCTRSKRPCEGYINRVVFKNPMGALPGGPFGPIPHYHPAPAEALVSARLSSAQAKPSSSSSQGPLPIIAPKPPSLDFGSAVQFQYLGVHPAGLHRANSATALDLGFYRPQYLMGQMSPDALFAQPPMAMATPPAAAQMNQPGLFDLRGSSRSPPHHMPGSCFASPEHRNTTYASMGRPVIMPTLPISPPVSQAPPVLNLEPGEVKTADPWFHDDEEAASLVALEQEQPSHSDIFDNPGAVIASRLQVPLDLYGTEIRSFHALAGENILTNYTPSPKNTPLNDPRAAVIFWYFVNVTAPALSLYERTSPDPSRIFSGEPVMHSNQHIWTYVFPVASVQHPALLQAILAIASLQMAVLKGGVPTASWKHYVLCIRRSSKNYQSATRRAQPATLAATLLLAFYEVWSNNHEKWCSHMIGARQLIRETPFREMSRQILAIHRQRRQLSLQLQEQDPYGAHVSQIGSLHHEVAEIDLDLLSYLTGKSVNFVDTLDSSAWATKPRECTDRDLENYEHMIDLYWWFCKMDVIQSILGASKLFMEYDLWTQCPPRAPMNRINQIYGTFDHLTLLLGRLSDFVASDLQRKRKAREWETNTSQQGSSSPPMFAGMFPGRGNITFPRGMSPPRETCPSTENTPDVVDLESSTQDALEEWTKILQAFELFKSKLGPAFNPLIEGEHPIRDSPFGSVLTYRTYSIAGIWMNFYMGLVILHRAHPSMPPFAMMAAHLIAAQTDPYANEIGRIAAGVTVDLALDSVISPVQSSALIECCFPIFVGSVQWREKLQRQQAIRWLHQITQHTGWQTGAQIASGCEGAWRKAAAMGVAPPYEPESESDALRHGWTTRRLDERIQKVDEGHTRAVLQRSDRAHVAFGLLSVEDDMERLRLED